MYICIFYNFVHSTSHMAGVVCGGYEPESNRRRREKEDTVERRKQRRPKNYKRDERSGEGGRDGEEVDEFGEELINVRRKKVGKFGKKCF